MEKRWLFPSMVGAEQARLWLESTKTKGMALGLDNTARAIILKKEVHTYTRAPHIYMHRVVLMKSKGQGCTPVKLFYCPTRHA